MERELDVLTMLLLDPCLTADEAAREAAARRRCAATIAETREARDREAARRPARTVADRAAVGF